MEDIDINVQGEDEEIEEIEGKKKIDVMKNVKLMKKDVKGDINEKVKVRFEVQKDKKNGKMKWNEDIGFQEIDIEKKVGG